MRRLLPDSLFGRLLLLLTGGLVIAQLIAAALYVTERRNTVGTVVSSQLAHRMASLYQVVDSEAPERRGALAQRLSSPMQQLSIVTTPPDGRSSPSMLPEFTANLEAAIGKGVPFHTAQLPGFGQFSLDLYLRLRDGEWLRIEGASPKGMFSGPWHLLLNLALMLAAVVGLVAYAARSTVQPITRLADAARELAKDLRRPPLSEEGFKEVRQAARAFNTMQKEIRQNIEGREQFLAAISHDLKTPLTRLQLRVGLLNDTSLAERIKNDIDDMQSLLNTALDYLGGNIVEEPSRPVDLAALVESLVDDHPDRDRIRLKTPDSLRFNCRPNAITRALHNLIDNAIKYGESASIELVQLPELLEISIEDEGEGLPDAELTKVLEPFYRVENSRSRETGGTGLGLAIVQQIVRSHGGDITLGAGLKAGLRVTLRLPTESNP